MGQEDIEPLEPGLWLRQWQKLAGRRIDDHEDFERALRHAFHLVQLAPRPLRPLISCAASEVVFEALLETGAFDSAMFEMLGDHLGFSVARSTGGAVVVAEITPPGGRMFGASGPSAGAALFHAWLRYLGSLGEADEPGIVLSRSALHTDQSELRRRPSGR